MTDLSVRPPVAVRHAGRRIRFVTAASLFDGHDAAINIMRRILQASGAEVIHLGHNVRWRDARDCGESARIAKSPISSATSSSSSTSRSLRAAAVRTSSLGGGGS